MIKMRTNYINNRETNTVNITEVAPQNNNSRSNSKNEPTKTANSDTINISDSSKNLTIAQRAKKVIDDTLSEFKDVDCSPYYDMTGPIADMMVLMDINGIHPIPKDILSSSNENKNPGDFIQYADNLKALAEKNLDKVPPKFLDFCDKLKENFIANGF
ncbi:hypothetical protein BJV85_003906 [Clostridium acetobutylicum]|uniref:Uncharacterized protein n=1 Tax=Clostridium acetobutylicum (strain ATCC 824 / DSM 792 / JCM 1419 / IAM 19013 / LMG 5710 / NBRC 13948 / NRRL B-527 / VKM B-1787 / 2291 / W) TaxID=272562 RepID=Q97TN6_CLOAB|nr:MULTISPECIES: hypothetical protein [Clostridium]AAK76808.1 Hypothetical protein, CF-18 family [Clostridium acetobutylicum ATCC 824]ADZ22844.1 Hypothetical protein, CF-18 family [Clostridium acetobutylicum EA 2018]AEI34804.1 hypothetical protein SMB_P061 [Clostridium acetobutylicum DSM 1731]AWV82353.1 hypothetical protein DK921_19870 [Clostridium acetobutylicum]MBC2395804.1 hypothetical protein [Clostridium acetobutylicum]